MLQIFSTDYKDYKKAQKGVSMIIFTAAKWANFASVFEFFSG